MPPKGFKLPFGVLVVLHEHVVPDLDVLAAMASRTAIGAALLLAGVDEHLSVGTARARCPSRTPPVILTRKREYVVIGQPLFFPQAYRLVVTRNAVLSGKHRHIEILWVEAEPRGKELETPRNRLRLEIVVERPVAEHLKEGKVGTVANRVYVAGTDAFLHIGKARAGGVRHLPHEVRHERVHSGRSEQHRRVVFRNHRCALYAHMALRLKK